MILGVGLVSLATLFPIGLLRMRDAARYARTKYLVDSAGADGTARSLLSPISFAGWSTRSTSLSLTARYFTIRPVPSIDRRWIAGLVGDPRSQHRRDPGHPRVRSDYPSSPCRSTVRTVLGANRPTRAATGCRSLMTRSGGTRRRRARIEFQTTRAQNGYYLGDQFEARFGRGSASSGAIRRTAGFPVLMACSGSPISIVRR